MKSNLKKWHVLPFALLVVMASCNNQGSQDTSTSDTTTSSTVTTDTGLNNDDRQFVKDVVAGNMAEVKMAQLAQQKATNKDVKDLGQMLEKDHSGVLTELRSYAS